ncbi:MAG: phosphonate ABC transporter, permease protein PhnE, partial [Variovorax sp.]|nr:phosphonate ABC transporter, permease protein PhnE [Variovorax sp.]
MSASPDLPPAPSPCLRCWTAIGLVLVAVVASFAYLGIDFRALGSGESLRLMAKFIAEFFPPDVSPAFLGKVGWGTLQTLAVSAVGTLLAALVGAVLALPASGRWGVVPQSATRFLLNFLRSVPELVWAALMVLAAGIGPFAG